MKRIGVIGERTIEKQYLMLYLGKLLSQTGKVYLKADQQFLPEADSFEYSNSFMIGETASGMVPDYRIWDLMTLPEEAQDLWIVMTAPDRESVEYIQRQLDHRAMAGEVIFLFSGLVMDSKISVKYLCAKLGVNPNREKVFGIFIDDRDISVHLENGYNDQLAMKNLSKAYKKILLSLSMACTGVDLKTMKRHLKSAERSK